MPQGNGIGRHLSIFSVRERKKAHKMKNIMLAMAIALATPADAREQSLLAQ